MAAAKRFTTEQIVAKLREAEKLQAQGSTIPQVVKRLQVSEQTFYRWRSKYGALKEDEAHRLKALEAENARLKRIVAEKALDISMLKDLQKGNWCARLGAGLPPRTWSVSSRSPTAAPPQSLDSNPRHTSTTRSL